jgi:asparagine synthase (glutamine-hydrolysing)
MCDICGVIQIGGDPRPVVAPYVLDHMTDLMTHRGPNDRGTFVTAGVALGVRRLSIIDVEGGHQPFSSEDAQIWAIQNGELYNHGELRSDLACDGHVFRSRCDTEILPHLYERFGPDFPSHLRSKFGLAVWDGHRRRVVLARDPLGIKPLYYAVRGDLLVFASELKSVLASGLVRPELDYEAIDAYLTLGYVPGPRTLLRDVHKLPPGHRLVGDPAGVRVEAYWRYPLPSPDSPERPEREYAERLLAELEHAVRLRLMSDVPIGAMLSGGLDSSAVVALMARNMDTRVKTFSIGFAEAGEANELADARLVAQALGTDHHELELSLSDRVVDLAELVRHLDEPLADLSSLGFFMLSELASRHVTVALCGQGADELFGGYRHHQVAAICEQWDRLPGPARKVGGALLRRGPRRWQRAARILTAPDLASRLVMMFTRGEGELRRQLGRGPLAELDGDSARRAVLARVDGVTGDPLTTALYLDAQLPLVDDMLHYFDRASMAHSLEVRVPFLDHHLVEYCATIPARFKVRRLVGKHVLKLASRGLVPDRIIDKPKIGFFSNSLNVWLRAQLRGAISEWLVEGDRRYTELLDPIQVQQLISRQVEGHGAGAQKLLLAILMLEVWLSSYLRRALAAPTHSSPSPEIPKNIDPHRHEEVR